MKKALILISMLLLCPAHAFAADIVVECDINYDNGILDIRCTTEADYNQALSVVLYEGNTMGSDLSKIVKIADTNADEEGNARIQMQMAPDTASGEYIISVSGGGTMKGSGSKIITFINKTELGQIIDEINSASSSDIKTTFEKYADIFPLPSDDGVYTQFLSARKDDHNNSFSKVNDIIDTLKASKLLYDINGFNSEADILKYIKDNAASLGADIDDGDFRAAEEKFAEAFLKLKNKKPLTGMESFDNMYNEALAISTVNISNTQTMTDTIIKYADTLGISESEYRSNCTKFGDVEINKALHDKDFESVDAILAAYKKRINDLISSNKSNTGGGGTDSGSSKGRGSAAATSTGVVMTMPVSDTPEFTDFTDLSDAAWASEMIKKLASDGIVKGYEDNSFKPNKKVTREEFVTMMIRAFNMYDSNAQCSFSDISVDDWCYSYVASAAQKKFVLGYEDGSFGKGKNISRQDAATMLYRVGTANGLYFNNGAADFADGDEISDYAKEAIDALSGSGIINGFENGSFRPFAMLTRAQAAKMIGILLDI